jgi:hypothetical protein
MVRIPSKHKLTPIKIKLLVIQTINTPKPNHKAGYYTFYIGGQSNLSERKYQ